MDEHGPDPQPGDVHAPPAYPATAVAASASVSTHAASANRIPARRRGLRRLVDSTLDGLDALADGIAGAVGLR